MQIKISISMDIPDTHIGALAKALRTSTDQEAIGEALLNEASAHLVEFITGAETGLALDEVR